MAHYYSVNGTIFFKIHPSLTTSKEGLKTPHAFIKIKNLTPSSGGQFK
jgi:hypothetical protein